MQQDSTNEWPSMTLGSFEEVDQKLLLETLWSIIQTNSSILLCCILIYTTLENVEKKCVAGNHRKWVRAKRIGELLSKEGPVVRDKQLIFLFLTIIDQSTDELLQCVPPGFYDMLEVNPR